MSIFIGLNVGNYLSDVDNQTEALRNLGINRLDLDHIRGVQAEGLTTEMFHNLADLDVDQEKNNFANYLSSLSIVGSLNKIGTVNQLTDFNLRLNHQLRAGAIKYNYTDYSGGGAPTIKSADISTSRVSSWSQVLDGPVVNGQPTYGPIFYGADTIIKGANSESIIELENIEFTGELTEKRFEAEVPTHRVTVNVNGTNRDFFTMRNIPFRFEGAFNKAKIRMKTTSQDVNGNAGTFVRPTILYINTSVPEGSLGREIPITAGSTSGTFSYNPGTPATADVFIDIYNDPNKVLELDFWSEGDYRTQKTLRINEFPNVEMRQLQFIDISNQDFGELPNFFKISGGELPGHTSGKLKKIYANANPLSRSGVSANQQLNDYVPSSVTHLQLSASFSDAVLIDIRQLKASGTGIPEPSSLVHFDFDANYHQLDLTRRMITGTSNDVMPYVNGNTIKNYYCQRHSFDYVNYEVTHNSFTDSATGKIQHQPNNLSVLHLYGNNLRGQTSPNGAMVANTVQIPDTLTYLHLGTNRTKVVNVSNKELLETYVHYYNYGSANPSGGINGYFQGCNSLTKLDFRVSHVSATVSTLFRGLPNLEYIDFYDTRLTGRMTAGSFNGTPKLDYVRFTNCNFSSDPGPNNFFGNDYQSAVAEAPPGGIGSSYAGGYYAGTMASDIIGEQYHLVVAPKQYEFFLSRFTGAGPGNQGSTNTHLGYSNTSSEYNGNAEYEAAAAVEALTIGEYDDWYIPARDELELMYRTLKPTTNANDTTSPFPNLKSTSPGSFTGSYTSSVPGRTSSSAFVGSQKFNSTTNHGSSASETEYMPDPNFTLGSAVSWTNVNSLTGTLTLSNVGNKLIGQLGNRAESGVEMLLQTNGQNLPVGNYEVKVNISEVTMSETQTGDLFTGEKYKILNLGVAPSFSPTYSNFNKGNNRIAISGHPFVNGTKVRFLHASGVTGGFAQLTSASSYYVISATSASIKLSSTLGGGEIAIADQVEDHQLTVTGGNGSEYTFGAGSDRDGAISSTNPDLTIYAGDTLELTNTTGGHPLKYTNGGGSTIASESGGVISYTFSTPGTYYYQCTVVGHESMQGEITVSARAGNFTIVADQDANWTAIGAPASPQQGDEFDALDAGGIVYGGIVQPVGTGGTTINDGLIVSVDDYTGGADFPTAAPLAKESQVVTSSSTTLTLRFPVKTAGRFSLYLLSGNVDFKINSINVRNQTGIYWSSTEGSNTVTIDGVQKATGMAQSFLTGQQIEASKSSIYNVRPVRKVPVASSSSSEKQGTSSVFEPCGGSLREFYLKGRGKNVSSGFNIRGKMPNTSFLTNIEEFTLIDAQITGVAPNFDGSTKLRLLRMGNNNMSGTFTITNNNVEQIEFQNNEFTGASVIRAINAWELNLSENNIAGAMPDLSESRKLSNINFQNNSISDYQIGSIAGNVSLNKLNLVGNNLSFDGAKRLFEDLVANWTANPRGGVTVSLGSNPRVTERSIKKDAKTQDNLNLLRNKGWTISMNA